MIRKFDYTKTHASDCAGDCRKADQTYEIKVSLGGKTHRKFNYVQLRVCHPVDVYLLTAYYLTHDNVDQEGELFVFRIGHDDLRPLIAQYGSYAHGTKNVHGPITLDSVSCEGNTKEYALRPTYGDACWRALLPYRVGEEEL